jgi:FAD-dependent urate hydroxylase
VDRFKSYASIKRSTDRKHDFAGKAAKITEHWHSGELPRAYSATRAREKDGSKTTSSGCDRYPGPNGKTRAQTLSPPIQAKTPQTVTSSSSNLGAQSFATPVSPKSATFPVRIMATDSSTKKTIAIIGAGIAGPTLALTILSHPILSTLYDPILYEKLPEPEASDGTSVAAYAAGAAVALTSNALFPLYELGLREEIDKVSAECEGIKIWRFWPGHSLKRYNEVVNPGWKKDLGTNLRVVERRDLQAVLLEAFKRRGGRVEWGRKLVSVREEEGGGVQLKFEGVEAGVSADFLVGADGAWSLVRKHIVLSSPDARLKGQQPATERWKPEFSGADGVYGVSRKVVGKGCEEGKPGDTHWIMLDQGSVSTWALPDGKQFWTLSIRTCDPPDRNAEKGDGLKMFGADVSTGGYSAESTEEILERHKDIWHPAAGTFGELFQNSDRIVRSPLWHRAWEASDIGNASVAVIGDASRVMVPSSGQGACFGIEDATVLANALFNNPMSFETAVREYVTERVPRSKRMASQSYWTGVVSLGERWWWRWLRDMGTKWIPMSKVQDSQLGRQKIRWVGFMI